MTTSDSITFTSQNTPENIEEAWREDMVKTFNKILNSCREQRYKNDDGQSIDENLVQYTSMIFKNYGHIIHPDEYEKLKEEDTTGSVDKKKAKAKEYYEDDLGSQYGIYYASNLIFDDTTGNDREGIQILEKESLHHSGDQGSYSADFILGNYYSRTNRDTALLYYDSAMSGTFETEGVEDAAKLCFSSSCLDLIKTDGPEDEQFSQKLISSIHSRDCVGEFSSGLDRRLTVGGHKSSLSPETWVDIQSEIILSEAKTTYLGSSSMAVISRSNKLLESGKLFPEHVLSLIEKSSSYTTGRKNGYDLLESGKLIGNLYNREHIDIKKVNETFSNLSNLAKNPYSSMVAYNQMIKTMRRDGGFKPDEREIITNYVCGTYGKIDYGEKSIGTQLMSMVNQGAINRDKLKEGLSTHNYCDFLVNVVQDSEKKQSNFDKADASLYVLLHGTDSQKGLVNTYLEDNLHKAIVAGLKDKKTSLDERRRLLSDYTQYANNNLENTDKKLTEEQRNELREITRELDAELITETAKKEKIDTLEAIDRLQGEGKISADEAAQIKSDMIKSGEIPITDTEMDPLETKVTVDGKEVTITTDFTAKDWYDRILNFSFKNNKSDSKEIIDVVSEYGWMNNTTNKNTSSDFIKHNNIPYCYAVEYRQLYNASISNIVLSAISLFHSAKNLTNGVLDMAGTAIDGMMKIYNKTLGRMIGGSNNDTSASTTLPPQDEGQQPGEETTGEGKETLADKAKGALKSFQSEANDNFSKLMMATANYLDTNGPIATSKKSSLLNPYRLMYILLKTNKQYCFPMLDKSASSYKVNNKMDEADGGQGTKLLGNRFFGLIANLAQTALGFAQDINQIAPFFQSAIGDSENVKGMRQYQVERSKFFSFPTDGEDIEVSFILFNTVRKNIWKKHFNFIFGFVLRNLPFKHDMVSYYPPLFYDVIVPGVKRCPYCYVERIDVSPLGLMRNMSMSSEDIGLPNLTNGGNKMNYTVNVPEAWQIKIVFKSLIATSGNQILSGFVDMPIQASSSNDSLKNQNEK